MAVTPEDLIIEICERSSTMQGQTRLLATALFCTFTVLTRGSPAPAFPPLPSDGRVCGVDRSIAKKPLYRMLRYSRFTHKVSQWKPFCPENEPWIG